MSKRGRLFTRSGFTLLELLAVMAMMALLTTLAVTSYFSAVSGMARRSAVKSVVNTLTLARQRACMEGVRINVVFYNELHGYKKDEDGNMTTTEDYLPSFVIVKAVGRISYLDGLRIGDEFSELDTMFGTADTLKIQNPDNYSGRIRLYNLTRGGWWMVLPFVSETELSPSYPYEDVSGTTSPNADIDFYVFTIKSQQGSNLSNTQIGDQYGIDAGPVGSLPKGFAFDGVDTEDDSIQVSFLPNGSIDTTVSGSKMAITLLETRLKSNQPKNTIQIGNDGTISYGETWN